MSALLGKLFRGTRERSADALPPQLLWNENVLNLRHTERRRLPGDMRVPEGLTALPRHKVCLRVIEAIQGQPSVHDLELSGGQLMDVDAATILRSRVSAPALSSISFRLPHFGL